jgi:hypothetical protein
MPALSETDALLHSGEACGFGGIFKKQILRFARNERWWKISVIC